MCKARTEQTSKFTDLNPGKTNAIARPRRCNKSEIAATERTTLGLR
jgi:hypothetical protein